MKVFIEPALDLWGALTPVGRVLLYWWLVPMIYVSMLFVAVAILAALPVSKVIELIGPFFSKIIKPIFLK